MFNGIVYNTGRVKTIFRNGKSINIGIFTDLSFKKSEIGSSILCDGVCLTLVSIRNKMIFFYLSDETLSRSNFRKLKIGDIINLEKSLIYGQKISGHFIQGHVDTTAKIKNIKFLDKTWVINFKLREIGLSKYLIEKASISINGVSLTISKLKNNFFETNVIPHTLKLTNLKHLKIGSSVNVELDIFAKYIIKLSN